MVVAFTAMVRGDSRIFWGWIFCISRWSWPCVLDSWRSLLLALEHRMWCNDVGLLGNQSCVIGVHKGFFDVVLEVRYRLYMRVLKIDRWSLA